MPAPFLNHHAPSPAIFVIIVFPFRLMTVSRPLTLFISPIRPSIVPSPNVSRFCYFFNVHCLSLTLHTDFNHLEWVSCSHLVKLDFMTFSRESLSCVGVSITKSCCECVRRVPFWKCWFRVMEILYFVHMKTFRFRLNGMTRQANLASFSSPMKLQ